MNEKQKANQFSKTHQPPAENKSKGQKKYWEYRTARQTMFNDLCKMEIGGNKLSFWEEARKKLQEMVFDEKKPEDFQDALMYIAYTKTCMTKKEKSDLILKLMTEFMPEDKNVNVKHSGDIVLNITPEDAQL